LKLKLKNKSYRINFKILHRIRYPILIIWKRMWINSKWDPIISINKIVSQIININTPNTNSKWDPIISIHHKIVSQIININTSNPKILILNSHIICQMIIQTIISSIKTKTNNNSSKAKIMSFKNNFRKMIRKTKILINETINIDERLWLLYWCLYLKICLFYFNYWMEK
jgi:hypothetical protein